MPLQSVPTRSSYVNPQQTINKITPEEQIIMMETYRQMNQDLVNQGKMPPLPPTALTPPDATGVGGVPLINNPLAPP